MIESNWLELIEYSSSLMVFWPFPIVDMETNRKKVIIMCFILKIID